MMFTKKSNNDPLNDVVSGSINLIGQGTEIIGNISCKGDFRIDGLLKGIITSSAKVVIGETGVVEGEIIGTNADISGVVKGSISVSELLFIKGMANINGDVHASKLVVESGARFTGKCDMGKISELSNQRYKEDTPPDKGNVSSASSKKNPNGK